MSTDTQITLVIFVIMGEFMFLRGLNENIDLLELIIIIIYILCFLAGATLIFALLSNFLTQILNYMFNN
ncbi:type IV secretory pathway VirB2 component (pilin) [Methanobacterium oryzae]